MVALLDDLSEAFAAKKIPLKAEGKRSIFRIHRDVRFAKDKSPYKTHCGATLTRSGRKMEQGLVYLHIDPEGCFVAAGFHHAGAGPARQAAPGDRRQAGARSRRCRRRSKKGKLALSDEFQLSRVPRGFEALKGGPLEGVVRLKSFLVEEPLSEAQIRNPKLSERIVDFTRRARPLLDFGWAALD